MSSSRLPQTGFVVASSLVLGMRMLGLFILAGLSAFILFRSIKKRNS